MKICCILVLFCCSLPALALSGGMETATVRSMRKVPCEDVPQPVRLNSPPNLIAPANDIGGDCVEYELITDKVSYIVRPRRNVLLLLGGTVSIKLASSELLLRSESAPKEIRCAVRAMFLRADADRAEHHARAIPPPVRCFESGHEIRCPD